jgi:hypothetical protein
LLVQVARMRRAFAFHHSLPSITVRERRYSFSAARTGFPPALKALIEDGNRIKLGVQIAGSPSPFPFPLSARFLTSPLTRRRPEAHSRLLLLPRRHSRTQRPCQIIRPVSSREPTGRTDRVAGVDGDLSGSVFAEGECGEVREVEFAVGGGTDSMCVLFSFPFPDSPCASCCLCNPSTRS